MSSETTPDSRREPSRRSFLGVFRYSRRAIALVWSTNPRLTVFLAVLTVIAGVLPAAMAWVGALIIDAVVAAIQHHQQTGEALLRPVFMLVAAEAVIVAALAGAQRGISLCQALLRAQLGHRVNVMILEKALTLELAQFEDSEFYDKLTRARRDHALVAACALGARDRPAPPLPLERDLGGLLEGSLLKITSPRT